MWCSPIGIGPGVPTDRPGVGRLHPCRATAGWVGEALPAESRGGCGPLERHGAQHALSAATSPKLLVCPGALAARGCRACALMATRLRRRMSRNPERSSRRSPWSRVSVSRPAASGMVPRAGRKPIASRTTRAHHVRWSTRHQTCPFLSLPSTMPVLFPLFPCQSLHPMCAGLSSRLSRPVGISPSLFSSVFCSAAGSATWRWCNVVRMPPADCASSTMSPLLIFANS
jgi:hypothetical protein